MEPKISIIIPVHNGLNHTSSCLKGIFSMISTIDQPERVIVIVIDDGSSDGTSDWITNNYPQTVLLKGDGSLWWSGAVNMGSRYAINELDTDFVLWWNNDITPSPDYLENLLKIIDQKQLFLGGSKIYYADVQNKVWSMGGIFDTRNGKKYMIGMGETDKGQFNKIAEVDWLPGMGTFIHRSVFEKTGFVDNAEFPQYHGDSDFTFRAKLAGYSIKVYPELKIWNDKSNSGLLHQNSAKQLIKTLHDVKSNYHILKDIKFYRRYSTSFFAYQTLVYKYCYYIGGFIKWRLYKLIGKFKKESLKDSLITH